MVGRVPTHAGLDAASGARERPASVRSAAALINGGDNGTDEFIARQAWLYVAILGAGYFISRGLAKSGSHEPYTDESNSRGFGHDGDQSR